MIISKVASKRARTYLYLLAASAIVSVSACGGSEAVVQSADGDKNPVDEIEMVARLLLPAEASALSGDSSILTAGPARFEEEKAQALRECLMFHGMPSAEVDVVVGESAGTITVPSGNILSREYVEEHGFGVAGSDETPPPSESDDVSDQGENPLEEREQLVDERFSDVIADCEEEALQTTSSILSSDKSFEILGMYREEVERVAAEHATILDLLSEWRGCMNRKGYEVADVQELISSLELEKLSSEDAELKEKGAALESYDCAGGEEGLREQFEARMDIAREIARGMSAEERTTLLG